MKKENLNFLWSEWSYILEIEIIVMLVLFSVLLPLLALMIPFYSICSLSLLLIVTVSMKYGRNPGLFFSFYSLFILLYSHYRHFHALYSPIIVLLVFILFSISLGLGTTIDRMRVYQEELKQEYARRKELEKKLKEREKKYRTIVENADELIFILNLKGEILYVNRAQRRTLGFRESMLYRKNILQLLSSLEDRERVEEYLLHLKEREVLEECIVQLKGLDNRERTFDCRGKVLTDTLGKPEQILLISSDITEKIKTQEKIRYLSYHDSLTQLYNRRFFEEEVLRLDTTRQLPLSIILGDINGLKLVNDAFGHYQGDTLIQKAARVLQTSCRSEDIIARWGGDEFVILLPQSNQETCEMIIERIRKECEKEEESPIPISISLGSATKKRPIEPFESIIQEAEDMMYQEKLKKSQEARLLLVQSLTEMVHKKSFESSIHIERIKYLAGRMGEALHLPEERREELKLLAQLHDIGKSSIQQEILKKEGPLSLKEYRTIKEHPISGYHIARSIDTYAKIAEAILAHHEHWNGRGYPKSLKGEEIPLLSRILAIIDAYDVMTTKRPYREALTHEEALIEIEEGAGRQFDPSLVKVFLKEMVTP